ncbi:unnamed protein product [Ilex paraguariensis]|uniref:AB hydrolase-1 domain-containing protein n=1 Tax=Ilex paraguariensis TaxID=185542 RepID=A0ABC8R9P8_9AQUA
MAKYKIVCVHGFGSSRHDVAIVTSGMVEELGVYFVSFDRPGYGGSDPDPKQTLKSIALDIEERADQLELGSKFYVIGVSMGGQVIWGCLKYIPHRLAGAMLIAPAKFSRQDLEIISKLSERQNYQEYATQQGEFESFHCDMKIGFGSWEFDPMDLKNPFLDDEGSVHLWQGNEDGLVPVTLQRYIAERLPWIHYHEVTDAGHLLPFADGMNDAILKALLLGEKSLWQR